MKKQIQAAGGSYTAQEVAELLNIPFGAIQQRIKRGQLIAITLAGIASDLWPGVAGSGKKSQAAR